MYHEYTEEENELISQTIYQAISDLISNDSELLESGIIESDYSLNDEKELNRQIHETAINHRLARYLENNLINNGITEYNVDIEFNRFMNQMKRVVSIKTGHRITVRPDIIVHKRTRLGENTPHLLVVEAKKMSSIEKDRNHVMDMMADGNYQYKFGLLVSYFLNPDQVEAELIKFNDENFSSSTITVKRNIEE